jgi:hypothetical protein
VTRIRPGAIAVAALVAVLAIEWLLFALYVRREIAWAYPPHFDQTVYLEQAYDIWEVVQVDGWVNGLAHGLRRWPPSGGALQLEAVLLFGLAGPSRLSALAVNWLHFAALQAALVAALWCRGRSWELPALGCGFLLCARAPFMWAGGMADFRPDFIAFCLYGLFAAAVWWSDVFRRPGRAAAAGAVGALCVLSRPLTLAYLGGLLAVTVAVLAVQAARRVDAERRRRARGQFLGALLCAVVLCVCAGPAVMATARGLWLYYYEGPIAGQERAVWSAVGRLGRWEIALYYLDSLARYHAGTLLGGLVVLTLGTLGIGRLARRWRGAAGGVESAPEIPGGALAFMTTALALPLVILTLYPSRSPTVGSLPIGPLVFVLVAAAARLAGGVRGVLRVLAILALAAGLAAHARRLSGSAPHRTPPEAIREVLRLQDAIVASSEAQGWDRPVLLADRVRDYVPALRVSIYERHGRVLELERPLAMVMRPPSEEVMAVLRRSHFVLLTPPLPGRPATPFPFDALLEEMHPRLRAYCEENMVRVGRFHVPEEILLFARMAPGTREAYTSTVTP